MKVSSNSLLSYFSVDLKSYQNFMKKTPLSTKATHNNPFHLLPSQKHINKKLVKH